MSLDLKSQVAWVPTEERLPPANGKYVVEIEYGWEMCGMSTRSYNTVSGWLNMGDGEKVSHWLEGLRTVTLALVEAGR